jgi:hypothetical protein
MRAIDRLKAACSMKATRRSVDLPDGTQLEYWAPPVTLAQRARAQKAAGNDDATQFALQLLVMIAAEEDGSKMFTTAEIAELTNRLPAAIVETLMLQLLTWEPKEEDAEPLDLKSDQSPVEVGPPAVCTVRGGPRTQENA